MHAKDPSIERRDMMIAGATVMIQKLFGGTGATRKLPVVLAWEPGQGKTFVYLLAAMYAVQEGKKVLIMTHN